MLARDRYSLEADDQPMLPIFQGQVIEESPVRKLELALYKPVQGYLQYCWAEEQEFRESIIEVTANQGRRDTGGLWSRPDLVCIACSCFPYIIPGRNLDVTTFEIKPTIGDAVAGVYETAAHSAFAHRSYLMVQVADIQSQVEQRALERITGECRRFGLGLITFIDETKWTTFGVSVEAKFSSPNPAKINHFISTQISNISQMRTLTMFK